MREVKTKSFFYRPFFNTLKFHIGQKFTKEDIHSLNCKKEFIFKQFYISFVLVFTQGVSKDY